MEDILTVGELIDQLREFDLEDEVILYAVGFTSQDSYEIELDTKSIDKFEGKVRISFI